MKYPDIYFEPDYAELYETEENRAVEYRFECEYGFITNLFLKRRIDIKLPDEVQYFDIVTPYGYGGPVIHWTNDKEKLIQAYMDDFGRYTEKEHIIAEFVRFHPILGNGVDFKEVYKSIFDRKTVGTNLTYDDVVAKEFSKHKRKDIRKALKNPEIRYEVTENPSTLQDFLKIYYSTMDRDKADDYYYFKPDYFQAMLEKFREHITAGRVFLGDQLIAMGVYFRYGKYLHAHLSGTLSEYLDYSPANILKYALAVYGHENGYEVIHYGGGTSRSPENGVYKFKKEFGKNTEFDFYIAKKVWNEEIYKQICSTVGADVNSDFFPAYRMSRE
ncbi:MAG: GNAT family N-acetyltransferase [Lachnospiraceae bacterium]|nr:GNAT family N-acetyltransferase [Lachnospiraceae bacterium]